MLCRLFTLVTVEIDGAVPTSAAIYFKVLIELDAVQMIIRPLMF